jgi:tetratricopeptide (TPR) repeat protein
MMTTSWITRLRQRMGSAGKDVQGIADPVSPPAPIVLPNLETMVIAMPVAAEQPARIAVAARQLVRQNRIAEASAMIEAALKRTPRHRMVLASAAEIADRAGNLDVALQRWELVRKFNPERPDGYVGALRTIRRYSRLDLAPPIVEEGLMRVGDDAEFLAEAAKTAAGSYNHAKAHEFWQRAVALNPENAGYALFAVTAAALADAAGSMPRPAQLKLIIQGLEDHHNRFPDHIPAYTSHINTLRDLGQLDEANRLCDAISQRFPNDLPLFLARMSLRDDAQQYDVALQETTAFRERVSRSAKVEAAYIRALSRAGRTQDAEQIAAEARTLYHADRDILLEFARIASRQADWNECVARLREASSLLPNDRVIARELQVSQLQQGETDTQPAPATPAGEPVANPLYDRFESLGGTGMGCEFGLIQRSMGSNSVGLLRWASTNPTELITALETEFEGVGADEFTVVTTRPFALGSQEYITRDRRYGMVAHTFIKTSEVPADRMYQQTCRRQRFLRGKILEDLRAAEKIFVYRPESLIDDETISALHRALGRYADNAMLCVMRAHDAYEGGFLRVLRPGLYVGYVSRFARDPENTAGSDVASWTAICSQADALWAAKRPVSVTAEPQ